LELYECGWYIEENIFWNFPKRKRSTLRAKDARTSAHHASPKREVRDRSKGKLPKVPQPSLPVPTRQLLSSGPSPSSLLLATGRGGLISAPEITSAPGGAIPLPGMLLPSGGGGSCVGCSSYDQIDLTGNSDDDFIEPIKKEQGSSSTATGCSMQPGKVPYSQHQGNYSATAVATDADTATATAAADAELLRAALEHHNLIGQIYLEVCNELGAATVEDLAFATHTMLDELPSRLQLKPIQRLKLCAVMLKYGGPGKDF